MILKTMVTALIATLLILSPASAGPSDPMATIKGPIDGVIAILNDPQYQVEGTKDAQRDRIWETVKPMFDFREISMRAVARNWRSFSNEEKTQFTDVFSTFLGNTYIDKIQGEYHNEKIVYQDQQIKEEKYAEVKTQLIRETIETPVNYRMIKGQDGSWKVYDIIVEGVSLVKNYRTQFANILQKETPAQLIQRLKDKLIEKSDFTING